MKIAINGTYSTGKTTTALALSFLTGITVTHARTMREILPNAFPGKKLEKCNFHELMELGMRRFTERIVTEKNINGSFISDGCPLQEWIYGTTRMMTGLNPSEKPWKIRLHKKLFSPEWFVFERNISAFGHVVKQYTKSHYDVLIHLPVEFPFVPDGHRPTSEIYRSESEKLLCQTYKELDINIFEVNESLEKRLEKIVKKLNLCIVMTIEDAISKAHTICKNKFDSVRFETERSTHSQFKFTHSLHKRVDFRRYYTFV
ncbi:MAG: ATP-binding protein [Dysgonamonadaceae bacterium]|jgi:nicotinamide riboside kinase|nr:ATP-binding protein [Dysgonamonadaceae bacterium]